MTASPSAREDLTLSAFIHLCLADDDGDQYAATHRRLDRLFPSRPAKYILHGVVSCSRVTHPGGLGHGKTRGATRSRQRTLLAALVPTLAAKRPYHSRLLRRTRRQRGFLFCLATHPRRTRPTTANPAQRSARRPAPPTCLRPPTHRAAP